MLLFLYHYKKYPKYIGIIISNLELEQIFNDKTKFKF